MTAQLLRVWKPEVVEDLIRDAITITERLDPPDDLRAPAFAACVGLLAQTIQAPSAAAALGLPGLLSGRQL